MIAWPHRPHYAFEERLHIKPGKGYGRTHMTLRAKGSLHFSWLLRNDYTDYFACLLFRQLTTVGTAYRNMPYYKV